MALPETIAHLRKRPSMHLRVVNYDTVAAFIDGFNASNDRSLLGGLQEWLSTKTDSGSNMGWSTRMLFLAFPASEKPWTELNSESANAHAIKVLFETLEEFVAT